MPLPTDLALPLGGVGAFTTGEVRRRGRCHPWRLPVSWPAGAGGPDVALAPDTSRAVRALMPGGPGQPWSGTPMTFVSPDASSVALRLASVSSSRACATAPEAAVHPPYPGREPTADATACTTSWARSRSRSATSPGTSTLPSRRRTT